MDSDERNMSDISTIMLALRRDPLLTLTEAQNFLPTFIQLLKALEVQEKHKDWPSPTTVKVEVRHCDSCSREYCSTINYKRHVHGYNHSKAPDKDSMRERLEVFWNKISLETAKEVVSFESAHLESVSGSSIIKSLSALVRKAGFSPLPQLYLKAGSDILEITQGRPSWFPISSGDLFTILDYASENTFLCGSVFLMQKCVFDGVTGNICLESKNVIASAGFLLERKLIDAYHTDKEAEALRIQQILMEEEAIAKRRRDKECEKKRQKKLKQRKLKANEQRDAKKADIEKTLEKFSKEIPIPAPSESQRDFVGVANDVDKTLEKASEEIPIPAPSEPQIDSVGVANDVDKTLEKASEEIPILAPSELQIDSVGVEDGVDKTLKQASKEILSPAPSEPLRNSMGVANGFEKILEKASEKTPSPAPSETQRDLAGKANGFEKSLKKTSEKIPSPAPSEPHINLVGVPNSEHLPTIEPSNTNTSNFDLQSWRESRINSAQIDWDHHSNVDEGEFIEARSRKSRRKELQKNQSAESKLADNSAPSKLTTAPINSRAAQSSRALNHSVGSSPSLRIGVSPANYRATRSPHASKPAIAPTGSLGAWSSPPTPKLTVPPTYSRAPRNCQRKKPNNAPPNKSLADQGCQSKNIASSTGSPTSLISAPPTKPHAAQRVWAPKSPDSLPPKVPITSNKSVAAWGFATQGSQASKIVMPPNNTQADSQESKIAIPVPLNNTQADSQTSKIGIPPRNTQAAWSFHAPKITQAGCSQSPKILLSHTNTETIQGSQSPKTLLSRSNNAAIRNSQSPKILMSRSNTEAIRDSQSPKILMSHSKTEAIRDSQSPKIIMSRTNTEDIQDPPSPKIAIPPDNNQADSQESKIAVPPSNDQTAWGSQEPKNVVSTTNTRAALGCQEPKPASFLATQGSQVPKIAIPPNDIRAALGSQLPEITVSPKHTQAALGSQAPKIAISTTKSEAIQCPQAPQIDISPTHTQAVTQETVVTRDAMLPRVRSQLAAANAIINALVDHLAQLSSDREYKSAFEAIHRRQLKWFPEIHMHLYNPIFEITLELQRIIDKSKENEKEKEKEKEMIVADQLPDNDDCLNNVSEDEKTIDEEIGAEKCNSPTKTLSARDSQPKPVASPSSSFVAQDSQSSKRGQKSKAKIHGDYSETRVQEKVTNEPSPTFDGDHSQAHRVQDKAPHEPVHTENHDVFGSPSSVLNGLEEDNAVKETPNEVAQLKRLKAILSPTLTKESWADMAESEEQNEPARKEAIIEAPLTSQTENKPSQTKEHEVSRVAENIERPNRPMPERDTKEEAPNEPDQSRTKESDVLASDNLSPKKDESPEDPTPTVEFWSDVLVPNGSRRLRGAEYTNVRGNLFERMNWESSINYLEDFNRQRWIEATEQEHVTLNSYPEDQVPVDED